MNEKDPVPPSAWLYSQTEWLYDFDSGEGHAMSGQDRDRRAEYDPRILQEYDVPLYLADWLARVPVRWSDPKFAEKHLGMGELSERERTIVYRLARTIATHVASAGSEWEVIE